MEQEEYQIDGYNSARKTNWDDQREENDEDFYTYRDTVHDIVADYQRETQSDPGIYESRKRELFTHKTSAISMDDFTICK